MAWRLIIFVSHPPTTGWRGSSPLSVSATQQIFLFLSQAGGRRPIARFSAAQGFSSAPHAVKRVGLSYTPATWGCFLLLPRFALPATATEHRG
jgi:hypothetical protein